MPAPIKTLGGAPVVDISLFVEGADCYRKGYNKETLFCQKCLMQDDCRKTTLSLSGTGLLLKEEEKFFARRMREYLETNGKSTLSGLAIRFQRELPHLSLSHVTQKVKSFFKDNKKWKKYLASSSL